MGDRLYRRHRVRIMLAITIGYGLVYTCRLANGQVIATSDAAVAERVKALSPAFMARNEYKPTHITAGAAPAPSDDGCLLPHSPPVEAVREAPATGPG